jgi:hypothetical protein
VVLWVAVVVVVVVALEVGGLSGGDAGRGHGVRLAGSGGEHCRQRIVVGDHGPTWRMGCWSTASAARHKVVFSIFQSNFFDFNTLPLLCFYNWRTQFEVQVNSELFFFSQSFQCHRFR